MLYNDDDDDDELPDDMGWGPIIVRRPVYEQGLKLLDAAGPNDGPPFETAAGVAQDCAAAKDAAGVAHWEAVADFLQWRANARENVKTIILEEGEEWDRGKSRVVRSGTGRRRSGKGS